MTGDEQQLVFVSLAGRAYAVPATEAREVLPMLAPTPVPAWPEHALGVVDVRGQLIPLLDVGPYLGRPPTAFETSHYILVLEGGDSPWACVIEKVESVRAAEVLPPNALAPPVLDASPLCVGVVQASPEPVVVLSAPGIWEQLKVAQASPQLPTS